MRIRNTAQLLATLVIFGVVGMVGGISAIQNRSSESSSNSKSAVLFAQSSSVDSAPVKAARDSSRASGRIINGSKASSYLDAASKWRSNSMLLIIDQYSAGLCGASFVTNRALVTAGHCVTDDDELVPAGNLWVTNGITNITGIKAALKAGKSPAQITDLLPVTKVDRHPSYNSDASTNDVAVLQVAKDAKYPAVPMVGASEPSAWGAGSGRAIAAGGASIAGWGNMVAKGERSMPDDLMEAQIPVLSDAACSQAWGSTYNRNLMLCGGILNTASAGAANNAVDTCQGDSGGPLIAPVADGTFRLIGITSFGLDCASTTYPGVYTKIDAVRSWIESITGPASGTTSFAPVAGGGATGGGATGGGAVNITSPLDSTLVGPRGATNVTWSLASDAGVEKVTLSNTQSGVYFSKTPGSNSRVVSYLLGHANVRAGNSQFCVHAMNGDFSCIPFVKLEAVKNVALARAGVYSARIKNKRITLRGQVASTQRNVKVRVVIKYGGRKITTNTKSLRMRQYPRYSNFTVTGRWPGRIPSGSVRVTTQVRFGGKWRSFTNTLR